MISTRMIPILATPVPTKTLATDGRLGTAADSAGGITKTPTARTVTQWIYKQKSLRN